jgi:hypothetical protein
MIEIIFEEMLKTTLKADQVHLDEETLALLELRNCDGFDIYNVFMIMFLSLILLRSLYQKTIIYMSHHIDMMSKILMIIQIIICASILPISTAFLWNITDFTKILYCMSGLLLLTNIDNYIAELFILQLIKNHKKVIKHKEYLTFETCEDDQNTAYWYVMILFVLNLVNNVMFMILTSVEYCRNSEIWEEAKAREKNFTNNAWRFLYYFWASSTGLQLIWICFAFVIIPILKRWLRYLESLEKSSDDKHDFEEDLFTDNEKNAETPIKINDET